ncbi:hypothetical protein PPL_10705 [Heterostelium album PN500]|uniref:IPT/TIG domain-containing protein n=1 Tax=Heterostelium pallidum (strain ATCC 26659 / Pp 5 / PN500) TaxID=670386 RepID=D3BRU3_HETP5|nr:hypothetical protein PPL_10705 [Heterostelium album PN500]EFA76125.1 hypothetical protein PPL_10705 [Heterostelium album PN500]|eukprot:XP_020428259.1 hypothetical protein PPL_10705 [Heterostelium album PN500]
MDSMIMRDHLTPEGDYVKNPAASYNIDLNQKLSPLAATFKQLSTTNSYYYVWNDQTGPREKEGGRGATESSLSYAHSKGFVIYDIEDGVAKGIHVTHTNPHFPAKNRDFYEHFTRTGAHLLGWLGKADAGQNFFCYNFEDLSDVIDTMVKNKVYMSNHQNGQRIPADTVMCRGIPCVNLYRLTDVPTFKIRSQFYITQCTNRIQAIYDQRLAEIETQRIPNFMQRLQANTLTDIEIEKLNDDFPIQRYQNLQDHCYWMIEHRIKGLQKPLVSKVIKSFAKTNIEIPALEKNILSTRGRHNYKFINPLLPWELIQKPRASQFDGVDIHEVIASVYYKRKFFVATYNKLTSELLVRRDALGTPVTPANDWEYQSYSGYKQDHSKFMIDMFPYDVPNPTICFGESNRHAFQPHRGGGCTCFEDEKLSREMHSFIRSYSVKIAGTDESENYKLRSRVISHLVDQIIRINVPNFVGQVQLLVKKGNGHHFIPEIPLQTLTITAATPTHDITRQIRIVRTTSPYTTDAQSPNEEEVSQLKPYVSSYLWTPITPLQSRSLKIYSEPTHLTVEYKALDVTGATITSINTLHTCTNDRTAQISNEVRQCLDQNAVTSTITYTGANAVFVDNQPTQLNGNSDARRSNPQANTRIYDLTETTNIEFRTIAFTKKFQTAMGDTSRYNIIIDPTLSTASQYRYPYIYSQTSNIPDDLVLVYYLLTQRLMSVTRYPTISDNNDQLGNAVLLVASKFIHMRMITPTNIATPPLPTADLLGITFTIPIKSKNTINTLPDVNDNEFTKVTYLFWKLMSQSTNPLTYAQLFSDLTTFQLTSAVDVYDKFKIRIVPADPAIENLFRPATNNNNNNNGGSSNSRSFKLQSQIKHASSSLLVSLLQSNHFKSNEIFELDTLETEQLTESLDMWLENRMISTLLGLSRSNEVKYLQERFRFFLTNEICPQYSPTSITHYEICRPMSIVEFTNIIKHTQLSTKSIKYSFGELEYYYSAYPSTFQSIFLDKTTFDGILIATINSKLCDIKLVKQTELSNIESIDICRIPIINNIIPTSNSIITISGTHFDSSTQVTISNGYRCISKHLLNSTNILCELPKLNDINNIVKVDNSINDHSFYVTNKCPIINEVDVGTTNKLLSVSGGDIVEIKGMFFGSSFSDIQAFIGHQECFIIKIQESSITCITPSYTGQNIPIGIQLRNCPFVQSMDNNQRVSYESPVILSVIPSDPLLTFPGDSILINGKSFGTIENTKLFLFDKEYPFELFSSETLRITIPDDMLIPTKQIPLKVKVGNSIATSTFSLSRGYFIPTTSPMIVPTKGWYVIFDGDSFGISSSELDNIKLSNGVKLIGCHRYQFFIECLVPPGIGADYSVSATINSINIVSPLKYISYEVPTIGNYVNSGNTFTIFGKNFVPKGVAPATSNIYFSNNQIDWKPCLSPVFTDESTINCNEMPALGTNQIYAYVDIGNQKSNTIMAKVTFVHGYVYLDKNFNNVRDSSEQVFTNCKVTLSVNSVAKYVASCDSNGYYSFASLDAPATYEITSTINSPTKYFVVVSSHFFDILKDQIIQRDISVIEDTGYNCFATLTTFQSSTMVLPYGEYDLLSYEMCQSPPSTCKFQVSSITTNGNDCAATLTGTKLSISYSSIVSLNLKLDNLVPPNYNTAVYYDSLTFAEIKFTYLQKDYLFKQYNRNGQILFKLPVGITGVVNIQTPNQNTWPIINNFDVLSPTTKTLPMYSGIFPTVNFYEKPNKLGSSLTLPVGYYTQGDLTHIGWSKIVQSLVVPEKCVLNTNLIFNPGYSSVNIQLTKFDLSYQTMFDRISFAGGYHNILNQYPNPSLIKYYIGSENLKCSQTQCYFKSDIGTKTLTIKYNDAQLSKTYSIQYTSPYGDEGQYPTLDSQSSTKNSLKINENLQIQSGSSITSQISLTSSGLTISSMGTTLFSVSSSLYLSSSCNGEDRLFIQPDGNLCINNVISDKSCPRWCLSSHHSKARYLKLIPYGVVLQNANGQIVWFKYHSSYINNLAGTEFKKTLSIHWFMHQLSLTIQDQIMYSILGSRSTFQVFSPMVSTI